jgi:DNA-binding NarL/FixJ family response regulator
MRTATAIDGAGGARSARHLPVLPDADPAAVLLDLAAGLVLDDPIAALSAASRAVALLQVRASSVDHHGALSPAEQRVALLAASGVANREIAERLYLSVRTIECHLSHVYAKLGVRSKAELAAFWSA